MSLFETQMLHNKKNINTQNTNVQELGVMIPMERLSKYTEEIISMIHPTLSLIYL